MRLGRQVPEAKEALAEGRISLSNASKLESFFANEKKHGRAQTMEQKKETLEKVEGMSQAECEKKLFEISPEFEVSQKEVLKPISLDQNLLKLVLDSSVVEQLNLLRDRLAHKFPNASYAELIAFLVEDKLMQIEKKMEIRSEVKLEEKVQSPPTTAAAEVKRRAIPIDTQRALWKRSGGTNDLSNLRHACRVHNGLFAIEVFGEEKMGEYMPRIRR